MKAYFRLVCIACMLCIFFPVQASSEQGKVQRKHVLFLNSYQNGYAWSDTILEAARAEFAKSPVSVELQVEYLDAKKYPEENVHELLSDLYAIKYKNVHFDVIICSDNPAFNFLLSRKNTLFPGVPVVFCGINDFRDSLIANRTDYTGIVEAADFKTNIALAKLLFPKRNKMIIIGNRSTTSLAIEKDVRQAASTFTNAFQFEFHNDLNYQAILSRIKEVDDKTTLMLLPFYIDADGDFYSPQELLDAISKVSDAPIFSAWRFMLGHGIIGGRLIGGETQAEIAARMTLDILAGAKPSDLPVVKETELHDVFDYLLVKRFNIPEDLLPEGSTFINEPKPFYELQKQVFWTIIASLVIMSVVLFFLANNILKRRRVEAAIKDQLSFLSLLMDTIPMPIYFKNPNGQYENSNSSFENWFGPSHTGEIESGSDQIDLELLRNPGVRIYEEELSDRYGRRHNVIVHKATYRNTAGGIAGVVGVLYDFTDRKKAEEKYRSLFENSALGIFRIDPSGRYLDANPAMAVMMGCSSAESFIQSGLDVLNNVAPELHYREIDDLGVTCPIGSAGSHEFEGVVKRVDGDDVTLHLYVRSVSGEGGKTSHFEVFCEDITMRRRAELELERSQTMLRTVIDNIPQLVYWKDRNLRFLGANKAFALQFGLSDVSSMIGMTIADIDLSPEDAQHSEAVDRDVLKTGLPRYRQLWEFEREGQPPFTLEVSKVPLMDSSRRVVGVLSTAEDITKRLSLEKQLVQSQKMEAIGTFVSGIAHDFNNILTTIINSSELALLDLPEDTDMAADIRRALTAAEQGSRLVSRIHTYARPSREGFKPMVLTEVVREALSLVRSSLPGNIRLSETVDSDLCPCLADRAQIHQIIMNLCSNAFQAMRDAGGLLAVSLGQETLSPDDADLLNMESGDYVVLTVRDTGPGIPESIRDKIFDPFFTTKDKGEGTGLGLSMVQGIIKAHAGTVIVTSQPGAGAMFEVHLPCLRDNVTQEMDMGGDAPAEGDERILFVEDNPDQLRAIPSYLARLGYHVTACNGADQSLDAISRAHEAFDVVVTDYDMPEVSGLELSRTLSQILPDTPVIMVSGRKSVVEAAKSLVNVKQIVLKPYSARTLAETIRRVLEQDSN
ncbi:hybrid sensor histidine kinase/response regulator [Desulfovibrio inopinatus]|uniref:hybrid sensor histidine kinase/response regulator n=1 Tax=Desulfovibrio inopinatus TaxID=102109 RepID=UPI0004196D1B|nr:PAS domain S-box protein [Desulfovibrio inopinatus]